MKLMRSAVLILLTVQLSLLAACAALPQKPVPPRVTLAALDLVSVELFEQRYRVGMRIKNPNAFDLEVRGIDFHLEINGDAFADGVGNQPLTVPAYGESLATLDVSSSLLQVLRQLQSLENSSANGFEYRIKGSVAIGPYGQRLPFDYSGRLGGLGEAKPGAGGGV